MPTTRKLTDNIEETVQLIYEALYNALDLLPREKLLHVLESAQKAYVANGWQRRRNNEFEMLLCELRAVPFKEENLSDFIQHFNEFVIQKPGGLKSNSANTLILHALANEYACKVQSNAKGTQARAGFEPMDVMEFTKKFIPLLREHLKRKVGAQTPILESKSTVTVPKESLLPIHRSQKKVFFVHMPTKITPEISQEALKNARRLAYERIGDYVCLIDANTVTWFPPGGERLIRLGLSAKKMTDFMAANDEIRQGIVLALIENNELNQVKVYFNKAINDFSDDELRKNPYVITFEPHSGNDMRLVRVDIRGRETVMPISSLLSNWVIRHFSTLQGAQTQNKDLDSLKALLCGLSLPEAKPLEAKLCKTAERALQNQLKRQGNGLEENPFDATPKANQSQKLDMARFSKIASIFGAASKTSDLPDSPTAQDSKESEMRFLAEIQDVFEGSIPPAPPHPFI